MNSDMEVQLSGISGGLSAEDELLLRKHDSYILFCHYTTITFHMHGVRVGTRNHTRVADAMAEMRKMLGGLP